MNVLKGRKYRYDFLALLKDRKTGRKVTYNYLDYKDENHVRRHVIEMFNHVYQIVSIKAFDNNKRM